MDPNVVLPLLSSVASFVFGALVFAQWLQRRRSFQLVWAIGLLWYGISAGTEFVGSAFGWSEPLYRTWYLIGAFFVAAYLGMGTVYLLAKTRFGYFVAATLLLGGLFGLSIRGRYPEAGELGLTVILFSILAATLVATTTWLRRDWSGHVTMAILALGSVGVAYLTLTAQLAAPGWAVDPVTHVPVGTAIPGAVRVLAAPFNIAGAFALVFGALFSAYVFMPKNKVMRGRTLPPVVAQLYGLVAVVVNFFASIPRAVAAGKRGELHSRVPATLLIAIGGFIPGVTSGLNRFGFTWAFFLGELLGVLFIFAGFLVSREVFASRARPERTPALRGEATSA
ncbi:MAG: hypothetical protein A3H36_03760 [Chloroflexi bacterium RIFCSPLOWO2_02_FULL_71_16]|nr:MAG: hypothetical protein A2082_01160 [Chloroflexi bacterium GWC2_70_10]OGO67638.1 MAG: hypothetical protein A3H36_03760 [Chloroflexi bacterium RIFCSPLOWO2_02_FULL_71_16]